MLPTDLPLATLSAAAAKLAKGLRGATEGKEPDMPFQSNVKTMIGVADLIDELTGRAARPAADAERLQAALRRIAGLQIRSAAELLERGEWRRIAEELQAIAQEAIAPPR